MNLITNYITQQYHQSKTNFMLVWQEHKPVLGRYGNLVQNQASSLPETKQLLAPVKTAGWKNWLMYARGWKNQVHLKTTTKS